MTSSNSTLPSPVDESSEDFDLEGLISLVIDNRWLIALVTGISLIISATYAVLASPVYEANMMVQVDKKTPDLPGVTEISQTLGIANAEATTEINLISSRMVLGNVVKSLGLSINTTPARFPLFGKYLARKFEANNPGQLASPRWGLSQYGWGGESVDIAQLEVPQTLIGATLTLEVIKPNQFLLKHENRILVRDTVGHLANQNGVSLLIKSLRANPGMRFLIRKNMEISATLQLQDRVTAVEKGKNSGIISLTYQDTSPQHAVDILNAVGFYYVAQNVDRNSAQISGSLQFVRKQLPIVKQTLDSATKSLNEFQSSTNSVDISLQTKALLDQEVAVDTAIQELRLQQPEMERKFTANHPAYQAMLKQMSQLQAKKDAFEKQTRELPYTQQRIFQLMRDVKVNEETYTALLNQEQQLEIARAGSIGNVRIVDPAVVDTQSPVKPKRVLIVLGGVMGGLFLALGFVIVRQQIIRKVETPADIEKSGLIVYASIPLNRDHKRKARDDFSQSLLAINSPSDLTVEALRSLRTSLHFMRMESKNNILMISGSSPNAGKTFISSNLGAVIAQSGSRVLVIDGDMRKGALHRIMGGQPENGLSELLSEQIELADAVRPVDGLDNLHFIARGTIPPNPSELLMHPNFTRLLTELQARYDQIIIDTPPILAVTDAAVIGHLAGTSILVVRYGLNQVREVALAAQRFHQNGVQIKGAVFNAIEKRAVGYYTYGFYEYDRKEK